MHVLLQQNPVNLTSPDVKFRLIIANCHEKHGMPDTVIPLTMYIWTRTTFGDVKVKWLLWAATPSSMLRDQVQMTFSSPGAHEDVLWA
jgi:hypothetical protein